MPGNKQLLDANKLFLSIPFSFASGYILAYMFRWIFLLGWIEAFSYCSQQAKEVIRILIHEIIPRFRLPWSLQSDNGSAFKGTVTQWVSKALGIQYQLHCSWKPQSSGMVEEANVIIKRYLCKLTQKMKHFTV